MRTSCSFPPPRIVREGEETAVFVASGGKAQRRPGADRRSTDGEHVEIVSGVKAGEPVIVDGQAGLPGRCGDHDVAEADAGGEK